MTNVTNLPEPGVVLDLDALERPEKDVKPPFVVKIADRKITFTDPGEIDWQDLAAVDVPADLFAVALSREDRQFFREQRIPGWKFNELMRSYYVHYDFEEKIKAAKRQAQFGSL